jgi:adenylosuccinate lyase
VERVSLPDATILLDYAQHLAIRVVEGMTVHEDRMRENLNITHGALYSQRALLALVEAGARATTRTGSCRRRRSALGRGNPVPRADGGGGPELDLDAVFDPAPSSSRAGDRRAPGPPFPSVQTPRRA